MSTNKPEVFYATNLYSSAPVACLMRRTGEKAEPVIRLSAYEALQAECEKLRKAAGNAERALKGLEKVAKVVSDNSDQVHSENERLRMECDHLRKDAARLDFLADPNQDVAHVLLPTAIAEQNVHSLRAAIDAAMETTK